MRESEHDLRSLRDLHDLRDLEWKPRLRENVWYIDPEADLALLVTSQGRFDVPVADALSFLKLRSHCTGHSSLAEIARRSALPPSDVKDAILSLDAIGAVYPAGRDADESARPAADDIQRKLVDIARIWREELRCTAFTGELARGGQPTSVLIGWLLEQYHLLKCLPEAIATAASQARGALRSLLHTQADARRDHAALVARTLVNVGLSPTEVECSTPLLTTRLLRFQMWEMFELEPAAVLLVEAVRGAQTLDAEQIAQLRSQLGVRHGLGPDALDPWFELQERERQLADADSVNRHAHLIEVDEPSQLDRLCNLVHDVRHAFDLLALEVKDYHGNLLGKYVPRQPVDFSSL
jgi:hypothetical protein